MTRVEGQLVGVAEGAEVSLFPFSFFVFVFFYLFRFFVLGFSLFFLLCAFSSSYIHDLFFFQSDFHTFTIVRLRYHNPPPLPPPLLLPPFLLLLPHPARAAIPLKMDKK